MKKKGLIISTVVMVVVLIASLTTATYAWFTASAKTEIKGFDVSVISNNAVNIGMKKNYGFSNNVSETEFVTGDVTFTSGTTTQSGPGVIASPGAWGGTDGLSSTLNHNINWGSQSKAVGVSTVAVNANSSNISDVNESNTSFWVTHTGQGDTIDYGNATTGKKTVIAANKGTTSGALSSPTKAKANINGEGAGDYVHFILGVSPTRALGHNKFVIMITPTTTTSQLGVLASIHVAYRVKTNSATEDPTWTEVDVYGTSHWNTKIADYTSNVTDSTLTAYKNTIGNDSATAPQGSVACVIGGLDTEVNKISQVEVVIYMAGADSDCNDQGKTSAGSIMMFFDTANATSAQPTNATVNSNGILSLTGVANSTIEYNINGGQWKAIAGSWEGTTFTATAALPNEEKGATIQVRQTESGKDPSNEVTISTENNQWK